MFDHSLLLAFINNRARDFNIFQSAHKAASVTPVSIAVGKRAAIAILAATDPAGTDRPAGRRADFKRNFRFESYDCLLPKPAGT